MSEDQKEDLETALTESFREVYGRDPESEELDAITGGIE